MCWLLDMPESAALTCVCLAGDLWRCAALFSLSSGPLLGCSANFRRFKFDFGIVHSSQATVLKEFRVQKVGACSCWCLAAHAPCTVAAGLAARCRTRNRRCTTG